MKQEVLRTLCLASGLPLALALAPLLPGCGGGGGGGVAVQPVATPVPTPITAPVTTGKIYGAELLGRTASGDTFDIGRSYVTLNHGVPVALGFEMTEDGVKKQPRTAITDEAPNMYYSVLPAQAAVTCFRTIAVFYFTGHPIDQYRPHGEPSHFHCVFLLHVPQTPDPPDFGNELQAPAPDELPPGVSAGIPATFVPGLGQSYDDPLKPPGQPARITIGQNYLYYKKHMNGMPFGENVSFLESHAVETDLFPQPKLYPRPGYYPGRWTISYDTARHLHIFETTEYIFVPQSKALNIGL